MVRDMGMPLLAPHLQMLNPAPLGVGGCGPSEFTLFPQLPIELRQKIWRHSLEYPRMLQLALWSLDLIEVAIVEMGEGSPPFPSQSGPCAVAIERHHRVLGKLLRVNSEAREAALSFYRVHIPCRMTRKDSKSGLTTTEGSVYINPEFDFVSLKPKALKENSDVLHFIHYFKSMDPRAVGVLNLSLDLNSLGALSEARPEVLDPTVRESVVDTLKRLRQVFFLYIPALGYKIPCWEAMRNPHKIYVNRSYPLAARSLSFQRIPRDPRAIGLDLTVVYMDWTSSFMPQWRETLHNWGITNPAAETRLLVTCSPNRNNEVYNYESAQSWLKHEDERYRGEGYPDWHASPHAWGDAMSAELSKEELEEAVAVRPAFGFWLFPADAFELAKNYHRHNEFSVLDLSEHWPKLCLWNLD